MVRSEGDRGKLLESLKKSILFRGLSEGMLRTITPLFEFREIQMGDVLFQEKDPSHEMFVILEGKVKASLFDNSGNELVLAELGPGEIIGEMGIVDEMPRSATVVALEKTKLAVLKRKTFLEILRSKPEVAINVIKALVDRLRKTDDMLEALAFLNVENRIVMYLSELAKKKGTKEGKYLRIRKMTHRELASRVGASREAVTKALKALTFKGVIVDKGNFWLISENACEEVDP